MTSPGIPASDKLFAGSIPQLYEQYLVPMLFAPYARDMAARVAALASAGPLQRVLELAAGTGAVTRELAALLPEPVSIVATDLNQPMLDTAALAVGSARAVQWRQADAQELPFADGEFDVVVCQFGAMFFPDKGRAFAQARRVLRPGGTLLFNVWDSLQASDFERVVTEALAEVFPLDPPRFLARTPHGYHSASAIAQDLRAGGFNPALAQFHTVAARSLAASARIAALALCQGTPLRNEIEARGAPGLERATEAAAQAIAERYGSGAVDGALSAVVVEVPR